MEERLIYSPSVIRNNPLFLVLQMLSLFGFEQYFLMFSWRSWQRSFGASADTLLQCSGAEIRIIGRSISSQNCEIIPCSDVWGQIYQLQRVVESLNCRLCGAVQNKWRDNYSDVNSSTFIFMRIRWSMFERSFFINAALSYSLSMSQPGWMLPFEEERNKKKFDLFPAELTFFSLLSFLCSLFLNLLYQLSGAKHVQWNWNPDRETELQDDAPGRENREREREITLSVETAFKTSIFFGL